MIRFTDAAVRLMRQPACETSWLEATIQAQQTKLAQLKARKLKMEALHKAKATVVRLDDRVLFDLPGS